MAELTALRALARAMGVHTQYADGLGREVTVTPETLLAVCRALGAPLDAVGDAADALRAHEAKRAAQWLPPVVIAWNGQREPIDVGRPITDASLRTEDGAALPLHWTGHRLDVPPLPLGYYRLRVASGDDVATAAVIAAPVQAWRRAGTHRSWGVGAQLAALRSSRSRSVGDLRDLQRLCDWVATQGGDVVNLLPLLPTFNTAPAEPSPYSPVTRLFWSELMLDLGDAHVSTSAPSHLDVSAAAREVHYALSDCVLADPNLADAELLRYARFRGAQARLGRNWRAWPEPARSGALDLRHVDGDVERFHLVAQSLVRRQLRELRGGLEPRGMRLGLDLAVGVHPDGYDPWSRPELFASGMSVGAPPDEGFPSGQDWGFAPVLPDASRREGHRYIAASIALQASLAGVLRIDHIMAWMRLYWIPAGFGLHQGAYVSYPAEELFAVLALESERHQCEVVGENLGTVPSAMNDALWRHRIWGMYLAEFEAAKPEPIRAPAETEVAMIGTHDTPTFAGWLTGNDIGERAAHALLTADAVDTVRDERQRAVSRLTALVEGDAGVPRDLLGDLLDWLGRSDSPLVLAWLEDLWLEPEGVNLPGTSSAMRANWQRPMRRALDDIESDPHIGALLLRLDRARKSSGAHQTPTTAGG